MVEGGRCVSRSSRAGALASGTMRAGSGGVTVMLAVDAWLTLGSMGWAVERTPWAATLAWRVTDVALRCL